MSNGAGIETTKIPPHNKEAEQAVLASTIIDANIIDELIGLVKEDDFFYPNHKVIFSALEQLHQTGKPLDMVTLVTRLNDEGNLEKAGGADYIVDLVKHIPNAANFSAHAAILRDKSVLRDMISAGAKISELAYEVTREPADLVDEAQQIAYNLGEGKSKDDVSHIREVLLSNNRKLEELFSNLDKEGISGVTSGFPDLDDMTSGFQRSDLIIVAGRPGMGKTAFGLNLMYNAAKNGNSCVFFSLEMSSEQLVKRIISSEAEIELKKLRTGNLNNDDWKNLAKFSSELDKLDIYLDDTPEITVNMIRSRCRRLKSKGKLDIVFVDYLQIMGVNNKINVREQQISEISRGLKSLAKELDIPVIAFAQVNRNIESRTDNRRPRLSDLRESGAIEQDADIIMFVYRDEMYNENTLFKNIAEIIIEKYRNGETGTAYLSFDGAYTKFGRRGVDPTHIRSLREKESESKSRGRKKKDDD